MSTLSLEHLKSLAAPDESAASLFRRTNTQPFKTGVPFIDRFGLRPGQGLELVGATGTGKTELLIQLAVSCILPDKRNGTCYGGSEGHVVLLDLDARFDPLRLFQVLDESITAAGGNEGGPDSVGRDHKQELFEDCLSRFHLVTCYDSIDVLSAIHAIPLHFESLTQSQNAVKLVLLDNLASFYWIDRACRSVPETATRRLSGQSPSLAAVHSAAAACMKELIRRPRVVLIATKWITGSSENTDDHRPETGTWKFRDYVPTSWQEVLTRRVVLRVVHPLSSSDATNMETPSTRQTVVASWEVPRLSEPHSVGSEFHFTDRGLDFSSG